MNISILKKKLLVIIASISFFSAANAQIIYTNVNPDSTIISSTTSGIVSKIYNLDLDKDGATDFIFEIYFQKGRSNTTSIVRISPASGNEVGKNADGVLALDTLMLIGNSLKSWSANAGQILAQGSEGNWKNGDTVYMPLKLSKGSKIYFGWVRLCNVYASAFESKMTVMDYAFNSAPNQPILAGERNLFSWVVTSGVSTSPYCAGSSIIVNYAAGESFKASNIFTAQLSDAVGSFANPVAIGSKKADSSGMINAVIPHNTSAGIKYRIRVVASTSVDAVVDNGTDIIIQSGAPNAVISAEGPTSFCAGNHVILSTPSSPGCNYLWVNGIGTVKSYVDSVWLDSSGTYDCIVTNACGVDTSNKIMVKVNPVPVATITPKGSDGSTTYNICAGDSVTLKANNVSRYTYQWYNYALVMINGATSSSLIVDTSGTFTVEETSPYGCVGSALQAVQVLQHPSITISGDSTVCSGDSVLLYANALWAGVYQWTKNGENIAGATAEPYWAKTAGTYACKTHSICGSAVSRGILITRCQGLFSDAVDEERTVSQNTKLKIAPNPFSNSTTISFSLSQSQKVSVSIFDITGRLVKTISSAQMQAGTNQLTWNAKDEKGNAVSAGIYFLKIQTGDKITAQKIIKE